MATVGLRGPALAFVGRRWLPWAFHGPALAFVDLRWPSLAVVGRHWLLWVFVDLRWPSLAVVGCCGPSWACVGLRWPSLAFVGRCWLLGNKNKMKILYIKKITHLGPFFPLLPIKTPFDDLIHK